MNKLLTLCMFALITGFVMAPLSHAGDSKLIEGNVLKIEAYGRDNGQARYLIKSWEAVEHVHYCSDYRWLLMVGSGRFVTPFDSTQNIFFMCSSQRNLALEES